MIVLFTYRIYKKNTRTNNWAKQDFRQDQYEKFNYFYILAMNNQKLSL